MFKFDHESGVSVSPKLIIGQNDSLG
jgi:hypothetical protein